MAARDGDLKASRQDVMASTNDILNPRIEVHRMDRTGIGCGPAGRRPSIARLVRAGLRWNGPGYRGHAIDRRQRKVANQGGHWGGKDRGRRRSATSVGGHD
jgi:hypothetical protein